MKWDIWFRQINADVIHGVEAPDRETALKRAREHWMDSNMPVEVTHVEKK